ncbi:helix-turn-helix domain-containing protein [Antribacter gilvus]|uniref:helix-turn-helix domain-containing protein n=1 Tax=Antribacter gilvus TaxID=2304675 RepID=UPI0013DEB5BF|nr:helix-turn-helix domain-containing protein [Antribacter gilvus]
MSETIAVPRPQAAALVGLSDKELKRAIDDGEIRVRYRGRKCLVDYSDLRAWFDALPAQKPGADATL